MTEELLPNIVGFLQPLKPFDQLPVGVLSNIARHIDILWLAPGETLRYPEDQQEYLYFVRSGIVEQRNRDRSLRARLGGDDIFGFSLHGNGGHQAQDYSVQALESTLIYRIEYSRLLEDIADYPHVVSQLALSTWARMQSALQVQWSPSEKGIFFKPVIEVATHNIALVSPETTIQQAAHQMRDVVHTSCAFVVDDEGRLMGMMTDKDMTRRVVSLGHDIRAPIQEVMTSRLHTVYEDQLAIQATILMMQHNIQNIPVVNRQQRPVGLITPQQLIQKHSVQAIFLIDQISHAGSTEALRELQTVRQAIFEALVDGHVAEDIVGEVMTMIYDAFTRRLIELAIGFFGDPPCGWSWVVAGSHARNEVHMASDQDNALILDDQATESDRHYFNHFAMYICKGLAECGYTLCRGRFMAATPTWCQRETLWRNYYRKWATNPEYECLLNLNVFIELRHIAGDEALFSRVDDYRHQQVTRNPHLLFSLLRNALKIRPPLGNFHNLVLEKNGDNQKVLNIKSAAIHCLVDIVRIYALQQNITLLNTEDRIHGLIQCGALNQTSGEDMLGTWRYVNQLRYQQQCESLKRGEPADNILQPARFGSFERQHIKDAFRIVTGFQDAAKMHFGV